MEIAQWRGVASAKHGAERLTITAQDNEVTMSNAPASEARISRRTLLGALAAAPLAVTPLALSGCAKGGSSATTTAKLPSGKVSGTLDYWITDLDSIDTKTVNKYKSIYVTPFEAKYPKVHINAEPQNDQGLSQKLQTALSAGQGPDILPLNSTLAIPFAQAGYLANLGPLAKSERWERTFLPWALDIGVVDHKLVALPVSYETLVLYYNKTLFQQHGWTPPTNRAELTSVAAKMESAGIIPFTNANADYHGATEHVLSCFFNMVAGPGKIHDALSGTIPWTDPAIVGSVQLMVDYFNKGWFSGGVKQYLSTTDPEKYANLTNGKTAMFLSGTWEIIAMNQYFAHSGHDWDWAPLPSLAPQVPHNFFPLSIGDVIGINSATQSMPAAEAYLAWRLTDVAARWKAVKAVGDEPLPIAFNAASAPASIDPRFISQYAAISKASVKKMVGYVTWTSFGNAAESYLLDNEDRLLTGNLTPGDFCAALNQAFQSDHKKGLIPPVFATSA